jgi:uncharacterized YigZ family protein
MNSIQGMVKSELTIKKSTFLGFVFPVESDRDVKRILDDLKRQYAGANHYCYAYSIGEHADIQKFDDDGEPSQTAGFPMMQVIQKQHLTNVFAVVIRFYGGIKLGASGLVRAYTKAVSTALKNAVVVSPVQMCHVDITVAFTFSGSIEHYLRETVDVNDITYTAHVTYHVTVTSAMVKALTRTVTDMTHGQAKIDIVSEVLVYQ